MSKKHLKSMKNNVTPKETRGLLLKEDETEYAFVTKKLGSGNFKVRLNLQNEEVTGVLRGKFQKGIKKKENWVDVNSVVLVSIRDFQKDKVDIVHVYNATETRQLKKLGHIIETIEVQNNTDTNSIDIETFVFDEI